jgi:hypothetical protein
MKGMESLKEKGNPKDLEKNLKEKVARKRARDTGDTTIKRIDGAYLDKGEHLGYCSQ